MTGLQRALAELAAGNRVWTQSRGLARTGASTRAPSEVGGCVVYAVVNGSVTTIAELTDPNEIATLEKAVRNRK